MYLDGLGRMPVPYPKQIGGLRGLGAGKNGGEKRGSTVREERKEEVEQARTERIETLAVAAYPGLSTEEAVEAYKAQRSAGQATKEFVAEYWPMLAAAGVGFLLLSFLPRGRRR